MGLWNVGGLISKQFNKTTDPEFLRKFYNFDLLFLVEKKCLQQLHIYSALKPSVK
jgi:hypothetical protein